MLLWSHSQFTIHSVSSVESKHFTSSIVTVIPLTYLLIEKLELFFATGNLKLLAFLESLYLNVKLHTEFLSLDFELLANVLEELIFYWHSFLFFFRGLYLRSVTDLFLFSILQTIVSYPHQCHCFFANVLLEEPFVRFSYSITDNNCI